MKDAEAVALLQAPFPGLTLHVRRRLLAEADGNALALLELPIGLELRRAPSAVLPSVLPLTERLERVFAARLETLPRTPARPLLRATARAREAPRADARLSRATPGRTGARRRAPSATPTSQRQEVHMTVATAKLPATPRSSELLRPTTPPTSCSSGAPTLTFIFHVDITQIAQYRAEAAKLTGEASIALLFRYLGASRLVTIAQIEGRVPAAGSERPRVRYAVRPPRGPRPGD